MKLKEYVERLSRLVDSYGDCEVIYSIDDEGNGFQPVVCGPDAGKYMDGEFDNDVRPANAVCIN